MNDQEILPLAVTDIHVRRAVYTIEGYWKDRTEGCSDPFFYDYDSNLTAETTLLTWEVDRFTLILNTESANQENPLPSGHYYFVVRDEKGLLREIPISSGLLKRREREEWRKEILIDQGPEQHLFVSSRVDLDTGGLYLAVETALPEPQDSFVLQKIKEYGWGIYKDLKRLREKIYIQLFRLFNRRKKDRHSILFTSGSRAQIGGNEEFVYRRMIERGLGQSYRFRFDFKPSINKNYPFYKQIRFMYRLATSDIIFLDDFYPDLYQLPFDPEVKIVQLWHACGAFKAVGLERTDHPGAPDINTCHHKCYTHVPVSSMHSARHQQEAFGIRMDKIYPVGIPRTDIFFDEKYKAEIRQKMFALFPQAAEAQRVILYAPTFRGNGAKSAYFPMDKIDLVRWGELLKKTNSHLIIKMHPFVKTKVQIPEAYARYMTDAYAYPDINDILFISDVMITDYSSVIYEFSLLRRPMLFYAFDKNMYEASRDFYEKYEDIIPGKPIRSFEELMRVLENEEYDTQRLEEFIHKNFQYTDGKSTDRVIDMVLS